MAKKQKRVNKTAKSSASTNNSKTASKSAKKVAPKKAVKKAAAKRIAGAHKNARVARKSAQRKQSAASTSVLRGVAPGLTVHDIDQSIAWYRDVLGFAVNERWEVEGQLLGAEMRLGDVTFNIGQDNWKMGRDRVKGVGVRMYITTGPKIAEIAEGIKSRGGVLAQDIREEWGMRTFSIDDPDGYKMTFMCPLK